MSLFFHIHALAGQGGGGGGGNTSTNPVPTLYAPLLAALANGQERFVLHTEEQSATLYTTLSDTPPTGTATALTLVGATAVCKLVSLDGATTLTLAGVPRIVGTTGLNYDFSQADVATLSAGVLYLASFVVAFASGQVREFGYVVVDVRAPGV